VRAGNAGGKRGGCSCGGAGSRDASCGGGTGCACGGGCSTCQGQDFVRPRFFAGQLLTEDDLGLLGSYVVEKSRLHNRSLFGQGVVCGLMVTCDPCGGGSVTVQPGYALDCCGNDLVVNCAQTVDVNGLVKRLRIERTGGVDCGDPCSDEKARRQDTSSSLSSSAGHGRGGDDDDQPPVLPPAEYCLYLRYCEQATDPVSPYATDDPCGAQACEATRIREGFTFELRCRTCDEKEPDNLFSRIKECLGNLVTTEKTARSARSALLYGAYLARAAQMLEAPKAAAWFDQDRLDEARRGRELIRTLPGRAEDWTTLHAFDFADAARSMAAVVAAWHTLPEDEKKQLENREEVAGVVEESTQGLSFLDGTVPKEKLASLPEDVLDREVVKATAERALIWGDPPQAVKTVPAAERQMMAAGAVFTKSTRASMASYLAVIKANLIERLQSRGLFTDCTLLRDLQAIVIPDDEPSGGVSRADAAAARDALDRLLDVLMRYLRQCICDAVNPPCPPCDDPAVLLACLRVEGCEVVDICNLERTFVLTPVAIRYWMPFLRSFGNLLERLCCPDDKCDSRSERSEKSNSLRAQARSEQLPRAYVERRSVLPTAMRWVGPSRPLDPARIAAILPRQISFAPENARLLAYSIAQIIDVVSLRQGVPLKDLLGMAFPRTIDLPAGGAPEAPPPQPAPPAPAPPAVAPETLREVKTMRADIADLKKRLTASAKKNRDLEARIRKLGG
jgi:hypothetical protein